MVLAGHSECSPILRVNCRHFLENYLHHLGQFDTQDRFHATKKEIKKSQLEYHYNPVNYETYLHLASEYLPFTVYGLLTCTSTCTCNTCQSWYSYAQVILA